MLLTASWVVTLAAAAACALCWFAAICFWYRAVFAVQHMKPIFRHRAVQAMLYGAVAWLVGAVGILGVNVFWIR